MQDIEKWLSSFVNSPEFSQKLAAEIELLDKPSERLRVRLELLSYIVPKVKGVDAEQDNKEQPISVTYTTAKS